MQGLVPPSSHCRFGLTILRFRYVASVCVAQGGSHSPKDHDPFLVLADYRAYLDCQDLVSAAWQEMETWTRMSILNSARMGKFSSDRSIRDYCKRIWNITPGSA